MKDCNFSLNYNGSTQEFNDESQLDLYIQDNRNTFGLESDSPDFRYSKDIAADNLKLLTDINEENYKRLAQEKEIKGKLVVDTEEDIPSYKDGMSVLEFAATFLTNTNEAFNETNWENQKRTELAETYKDMPANERALAIDKDIADEKQSWEDIKKMGKGIHILAEKIFTSSKNMSSKEGRTNLLKKIREDIKAMRSDNITLDGVSDAALDNIIQNIYRIKANLTNGRQIKKVFPEFCIDYDDGGDMKVRGKIDLLVMYDNNEFDIIDIKVSKSDESSWDRNKVSSMDSQLRVYGAMLEAKGLAPKRLNLNYIPIHLIKEGDTYSKSNMPSEISKLNPDTSKRTKITTLLKIKPELKALDSEITKTTISTVAKMFGYNPYNSEIEEATLERVFKDWCHPTTDGGWKFTNVIDKKEVIRNTKEELLQELRTYLKLLQAKRVDDSTHIYEALVKGINGKKNKSYEQLKIFNSVYGSFAELNAWMNRELYKYRAVNGWKVIENTDLLQLGVIGFINSGTQEVDLVSITWDDAHAKIPLAKGNTILGNYYSNKQVESEADILPSSLGNMELVKMITMANHLGLPSDYTISDIKVLDLGRRTDFFSIYSSKISKMYNELARKSGTSPNKMKFTDEFSKVFSEYSNIISPLYDSYLKGIGVNQRSLEGILLDEELDKNKKLASLKALRAKMEATIYVTTDPKDDFSLVGDLYRRVVESISVLREVAIDYHNETALPTHFGSFSRGFKEETLLNSTMLNSVDTIPMIIPIAGKISKGNRIVSSMYNAYKVKDRAVTDKFYKENGNRLAANSIVNMHEVTFSNLFDKSENGKTKMLLKDYRTDTSLNAAEKAYIKYWLDDINSVRYKGLDIYEVEANMGIDKWFEIPLLKAQFASQVLNGENVGTAMWSRTGLPEIDPRAELGMESTKTDFGRAQYLFEGMYNGFRSSEDSVTRLEMIKSRGEDPYKAFETNLEIVKDMYRFSKFREEVFNPILSDVSASLGALATMSSLSRTFTANQPILDFVTDYIKSAVLDMSLVEENNKDVYKIAGMAKSTASKLILGFNAISGVKETAVGWWTLYNAAIANSLSDSTRFGVKDATKAYAMVWGDSFKQIFTITLGEHLNFLYDMANMSPDELVKRQNYGKGDILRLDERMFWMSRAPDFLHRMTVMVAYMIKHGCLDAHKVVDGHMEYNWKKDKRFERYANNDKSDINLYNEQRALFERMREIMVEEGVRVVDWEVGTTRPLEITDDFLPQAYTLKEAVKIKTEADSMYGYMDNDTKSMFFRKGIGLLIGQFKTFFSAKKNQYFLARNVYNNGSMQHVKDLDGNKLYWTYDENGDKITTTEVTEHPVMDWVGSPMEGIFWSLKSLFNLFNLRSPEGRQLLKEAWQDPIKRRNFYLALGDLFGSLMFMLLSVFLFGDLTPDEMSIAEKAFDKVLKNASGEFNVPAVFVGQVDFQFTGYEVMSSLGESIGNLIAGDTNAMRLLATNVGALRPFKSKIFEEFPVE